LSESGERLASAHRQFDELGLSAGAGRAAAWTAEQRYRCDDPAGADQWATTAERATGDRTRDAAVWLGVRAKLSAGHGDLATAHDLAGRAAALVDGTDALTDRADATLNLAQVASLGGDLDLAGELGRAAESLYAAKGYLIGAARAREGIGR
jgi:ATP/maltotriose-dependent transcriptional regulator MalT